MYTPLINPSRAREFEAGRDDLIIFAGACQSHYESLIRTGAKIIAADKPHLSMSVRPMNYAEAYQIMQEIYHGS